MKKIIASLISGLILSFSSVHIAAAADTYKFDPTHTYVLWRINHFGFSHPAGKWLADGKLVLDEAHPQNSHVEVIINVADMDTGIEKLDEHLKGSSFFDTDKYPTATFISQKIKMTSKDTAQIFGILTVHGVPKPVVLNVRLNKIGLSPITQRKTAGFSAMTKLKRSDFGITAYLPGLGDDVTIDIEVEANKI